MGGKRCLIEFAPAFPGRLGLQICCIEPAIKRGAPNLKKLRSLCAAAPIPDIGNNSLT